MNDLVEVKKGEILVESNLVARKFGMQHSHFMNAAEKTIKKLCDLRHKGFMPKHYRKFAG